MFENVDEGHTEGEEKIVFRYNREERLKGAPQIVRDYYDGKMTPVRGFKVLWTNKSNRFILLSLVIFVAFVWIFTAINNTRSYCNINGLECNLSSFAFQEEIYVSIKLQNKKADEKSAPVKLSADVTFINADNQTAGKKELFYLYSNGEQTLATKVTDYDIIRVDVIIKAGDVEKEISAAVKR